MTEGLNFINTLQALKIETATEMALFKCKLSQDG